MKRIRRSKSLTEIATEEIRSAIMDGTLALGQLLSENALAKLLGISRTPIREALSQLRLEGLVRATPKGSYVFTLSSEEVRELCELRFGLESLAINSAIMKNQIDYSSNLANVVKRMDSHDEFDNVSEYLRLDVEFHQLAFNYSNNRYLAQAYKMIEGKIAALRTHLAVLHEMTGKTLSDHHDILEAVTKDDADTAISILDKHINSVNEYYESNVKDIAEADRKKGLGTLQ